MTMMLCYKNVLDDGAVAASSEATDHAAVNTYDWEAYSSWSPSGTGDQFIKVDVGSAVSPNYFAVMYENQGASAVDMDIEHSSDDFVGDVNSAADWSVAAGDRGIKFGILSGITKQHWRLKTNATHSDVYIRVIAIGTRLDMQRGIAAPFTPPHMADNDKYLLNKSIKGIPLGNSIIGYGWASKFSINRLTPEWVRDSFEEFREHAKIKKFILVWNYEQFPDEVALAWRVKAPFNPRYHTPNRMMVPFDLGYLIR